MSRDGWVAGSFEQPGTSRIGMTDLTWDGQLLWGSGERTVYGFDRQGTVSRSWSGTKRGEPGALAGIPTGSYYG